MIDITPQILEELTDAVLDANEFPKGSFVHALIWMKQGYKVRLNSWPKDTAMGWGEKGMYIYRRGVKDDLIAQLTSSILILNNWEIYEP